MERMDASNPTRSLMSAMILALTPLSRKTRRMPSSDAKGGWNHSSANGASNRAGQGCIVPTSGRNSWDPRVLILEWKSRHVGLHSFKRRCRTNSGTKCATITPTLLAIQSETCRTPRPALNVQNFETRTLLATYEQRCVHITVVGDYRQYAINRAGLKQKRHMNRFPPSEPEWLVTLPISSVVQETTTGMQLVDVKTNQSSRITLAILSSELTALQVASNFFEHFFVLFGIPVLLLTYSQKTTTVRQLYFLIVIYVPCLKHFTNSAYYWQINGQAEHYNKTIVARLRHYVVEHQRNWDVFTKLLRYAYGTQMHFTMGTTSFRLVLSWLPSQPGKFSTQIGWPMIAMQRRCQKHFASDCYLW